MTDDGLILTFDRKFYYQTAYRNLQSIREAIHQKTGTATNVVLAFSDNPNNNVDEESAPEEPAPQEEAPQPESIQEEQTSPAEATTATRTEEQKNLINDLILCFDGREEN